MFFVFLVPNYESMMTRNSCRANWILYAVCNRFMEMMNGHLGSVNKELEFSAALPKEIQCIHIVNALFLEKQTVQY